MPAATVPEMVHSLDVSALRCPMTWVRTKVELERLEPGQTLEVTLPAGRGGRERPALRARGRPRRRRRRHHDPDRAGMSEGELPPRPVPRARRGRRPRRDPRREAGAEGRAARRRCSTTTSSSATRASCCCRSGRSSGQVALRNASVLVIGAGALGSPVALYLGGRGRRAPGDRRRRRRRALQPAPPAAALHAGHRPAQGRVRRRQAALPQPGHRRRVLPRAGRREQRRSG